MALLIGGSGCSSDNFSVDENTPSTSSETTATSGAPAETATSTGATADSGDGDTRSDSTGNSDTGVVPTNGWEGDRKGPRLSDLDTALGNFNADLPEPTSCEDLPEEGCANITGLVAGEPVELSCEANSFVVEDGDLRCEGNGFDLWLGLKGFVGAPPSSFNFMADPANHPIGFSYDSPWFESHDADGYAVSETHEQNGLRTTGVRYSLLDANGVSHEFVDLVFVLHFLPRPSCPTCPEIRLRGRVGAYTGTAP